MKIETRRLRAAPGGREILHGIDLAAHDGQAGIGQQLVGILANLGPDAGRWFRSIGNLVVHKVDLVLQQVQQLDIHGIILGLALV